MSTSLAEIQQANSFISEAKSLQDQINFMKTTLRTQTLAHQSTMEKLTSFLAVDSKIIDRLLEKLKELNEQVRKNLKSNIPFLTTFYKNKVLQAQLAEAERQMRNGKVAPTSNPADAKERKERLDKNDSILYTSFSIDPFPKTFESEIKLMDFLNELGGKSFQPPVSASKITKRTMIEKLRTFFNEPASLHFLIINTHGEELVGNWSLGEEKISLYEVYNLWQARPAHNSSSYLHIHTDSCFSYLMVQQAYSKQMKNISIQTCHFYCPELEGATDDSFFTKHLLPYLKQEISYLELCSIFRIRQVYPLAYDGQEITCLLTANSPIPGFKKIFSGATNPNSAPSPQPSPLALPVLSSPLALPAALTTAAANAMANASVSNGNVMVRLTDDVEKKSSKEKEPDPKEIFELCKAAQTDIVALKKLLPTFKSKYGISNPYFQKFSVMHYAAKQGKIDAILYLETEGGDCSCTTQTTSKLTVLDCLKKYHLKAYSVYEQLKTELHALIKERKTLEQLMRETTTKHRKEMETLMDERLANKNKVQILEMELKGLQDEIVAGFEPIDEAESSLLKEENKVLEEKLKVHLDKIKFDQKPQGQKSKGQQPKRLKP